MCYSLTPSRSESEPRRLWEAVHCLGLGLMALGQRSVVEAVGGMRRPRPKPGCMQGCRQITQHGMSGDNLEAEVAWLSRLWAPCPFISSSFLSPMGLLLSSTSFCFVHNSHLSVCPLHSSKAILVRLSFLTFFYLFVFSWPPSNIFGWSWYLLWPSLSCF